ncbi:hypothetical protein [Saccharothrix australiensis]|uniref:hypothetical protein n=1 Tax=Saccharothrix australiensis TaxID=2072 RepID=UPI000EB4B34F|nr:hypothetical protein [Saccharothrix australiensis]
MPAVPPVQVGCGAPVIGGPPVLAESVGALGEHLLEPREEEAVQLRIGAGRRVAQRRLRLVVAAGGDESPGEHGRDVQQFAPLARVPDDGLHRPGRGGEGGVDPPGGEVHLGDAPPAPADRGVRGDLAPVGSGHEAVPVGLQRGAEVHQRMSVLA